MVATVGSAVCIVGSFVAKVGSLVATVGSAVAMDGSIVATVGSAVGSVVGSEVGSIVGTNVVSTGSIVVGGMHQHMNSSSFVDSSFHASQVYSHEPSGQALARSKVPVESTVYFM